MIGKNDRPQMHISQQSVVPPTPQPRPQMPPRPPVERGVADTAREMMRWTWIILVTLCIIILVIPVYIVNFNIVKLVTAGLIPMLPWIGGLLLCGVVIKFVEKRQLTKNEEKRKQAAADANVRTVDARIRSVDSAVKDREKQVTASIEDRAKQVAASIEDKRLDFMGRYEQMLAAAEERRASALQKTRFIPTNDQNSAIGVDPRTGQFVPIAMPHRELPSGIHSLSYHDTRRITGISEEVNGQKQIEASTRGVRIPTFSESMNAGLLGPGQKKLLVCHELERDEETGLITGITPSQRDLEDVTTLFVGGMSKSGKTTFMAHLCAQAAMMNALFYVIDPHREHPERSLTAKLAPMRHAFILPPAKSVQEIAIVKQHAQREALMRIDKKETLYSGRLIFFVFDEALAALAAARTATTPEERAFWTDFMQFLQNLGTQYNKFGMNGLFASQYVTKEAFKFPGSVDFRDACQSLALFRLPHNQAGAMHVLESADLKDVRQLPTGHGYLQYADGGLIRMASGDVAAQDIQQAAMQVERAPVLKRYIQGTDMEQSSNSSTNGRMNISEEPNSSNAVEQDNYTVETEELEQGGTPDVEPLEQSTDVPGTVENAGAQKRGKKEFTDQQAITFLAEFDKHGSIPKAIAAMGISYGDYQAAASRLVKQMREGA